MVISVKVNAQWTDNGSTTYTTDNVGIDVSTAYKDLELYGNKTIRFRASYYSNYEVWDITQSNDYLYFKHGSSTSANPLVTTILSISAGNLSHTGDMVAAKFRDKSSSSYYLDPANTGISLNVAGKIQSKEIEVLALNTQTLKTDEIQTSELIVDYNNLADYVFNVDYSLPSLKEVADYIEQNKHLPGMPTAEEVKENGMNIAEMNNLLLQKVEELTLYILELQKRIDSLE